MINKNNIFKILVLLSFSFACNSQAYEIKYYQSNYDTLVNYNSVNLDLAFEGVYPYVWEKTFDFGFNFPFYDSTYNSVIIDSDGVGLFPGSPEYNFNLFSGQYIIDFITDTSYLHSEVRYASIIENNFKIFIIEYHNVYNLDEFDENGTNHKINFQIRFCENGIIELHFGEIILENCSYYFPDQGFSFDNSNPSDNIYGPWVGINNNDLAKCAFFQGNHNTPELIYDRIEDIDVLTSIPPEGFIIKFIPHDISSNKENVFLAMKYSLVYKNNGFEIQGEMNDYISCEIFDITGNLIVKFYDNHYSFHRDSPKILFVRIRHKNGYEIHKIVQ